VPALALVLAAACRGGGTERLDADAGDASTPSPGPRITTPQSGGTENSTASDVTIDVTSTTGSASTSTAAPTSGTTTTTTGTPGRRSSTTTSVAPRTPTAQEIVFSGPPADWQYGKRVTLGLTATSGLALHLTTSGPCTVVNEALHVLEATGVGECVLTVTQPGDATYAAATPITSRMPIRRAATEIVNFQNATYEYLGQNTFQLGAAATSGAPAQYATHRVGCAISPPGSATLQFQGTGILPTTCDVTVTFAATPTFEAASLTRSITLNPTDMTIDVVVGTPSGGSNQVTVTFNHAALLGGYTEDYLCLVTYDRGAHATTHTVTVSPDPARPPAPASCSVSFGNVIPDGSVRSVSKTVSVPLA
jgi:hypothetical protein